MNLDLLGQRFLARIFPSRRTAKHQRNKTRSVFAGLDHNGGVGGGDFSIKLRSVRVGYAHCGAPDERRRQRETSCGSQDGRTVWYAL